MHVNVLDSIGSEMMYKSTYETRLAPQINRLPFNDNMAKKSKRSPHHNSIPHQLYNRNNVD